MVIVGRNLKVYSVAVILKINFFQKSWTLFMFSLTQKVNLIIMGFMNHKTQFNLRINVVKSFRIDTDINELIVEKTFYW